MTGVQIGWGYDTHRFARGRKLVLGGVSVPHTHGLKGHSDADVLTHAVIDALLGAAGLGDIGSHFPDSDPRYKGISSLKMLEAARRMIAPRFRVAHVDATVLCEVPKLGPYRQRIRAVLAAGLKISVDNMNIKAKTNEGMGFIGRRQGMAAVAVATLTKRRS